MYVIVFIMCDSPPEPEEVVRDSPPESVSTCKLGLFVFLEEALVGVFEVSEELVPLSVPSSPSVGSVDGGSDEKRE